MSGSTIRLRRQIPYCLAAEMLLCGEHITAQQALDFGLINKMVPAGKTLEAAKEYAQKICSNGPLAVRAVGEVVARTSGMSLGRRCDGRFRRVSRSCFCVQRCERGHEGFQGKTPR